jgi:hypothetical protein
MKQRGKRNGSSRRSAALKQRDASVTVPESLNDKNESESCSGACSFDDPIQSWARLDRVINDFEVVIFLGAGTSLPNKLPSWNGLVARVGGAAEERVELLAQRGLSLPTQLSLCKDQAADQGVWADLVRRCLYEQLEAQIKQWKERLPDLDISDFDQRDRTRRLRVKTFFKKTNPVLYNLVKAFGVQEGAESEYTGNPAVGAVLTTNLDALIQLCDRACHGSRVLRTVERSNTVTESGKVSLYHLHGYLQVRRNPGNEASDRLVISEEDYLERNDNPYSWANVILHWALREYPVIFVGCSLTDELVRRALRRSCTERRRDLMAKNPRKRPKEEEWRRQFAVMKLNPDHQINTAINSSLAALGVWPLWVEDYESSLVARIRHLRKSLSIYST